MNVDELIQLLENRGGGIDASPQTHPLSGEPDWSPQSINPKGANSKAIEDFSNEHEVIISDDLREWLKLTNGGSGFYGIDTANEGCRISEVWETYTEFRTKNWIPVAHDSFGNFYVSVQNTTRQPNACICFVEGTDSESLNYVVASNMLRFAWFMLNQECAELKGQRYDWPFNREFVVSNDPEILQVTVAPLPWN